MNKFVVILLSAVSLSAPVMAQELAQELATDLLVPASAWLVGPTTLADGSAADDGGMPCVMVNKFSNNSEMRLSGGGEEILALALNVGEKTFEIDQSYLMTITFDEQEPIKLPAQAFSEDTIVVGTEPGKDFYKSLKASPTMVISLGASTMEFSLLGVPQGLKRLEECYKPLPVAAAQPVPAEKADAPGIHRLDPEGEKKISEMLDQATGDALPAEPTVKKEPEPEKVAEKPEVKAEAPQPQPAPQPLREVKPRDILTPGTATAVTGEGQQMRWRVMKGANLQSIFEVWAQSAQARLIWNAGQGFSVPESLAMQGTFEGAVEAVLGQFPLGESRPVGKIYTDPTLKQKVLVIEADKPPVPTTAEGSYAPIVAP